MAKYGARYLRFAPFAAENAEPDNSYPNYGTAVSVGKLVKVSDAPSLVEAKHYADDELDEYVAEIGETDLGIEVSEISNDVAASVLGASKDEQTGDVAFGEDTAPYGGLGFVSCRIVNGVKGYIGVYYPKVKAAMQGEDYETKGENITFANGKLKMKASLAKNHKWKVISASKATPELAKTWVDQKLGAPASGNP